MKCNHCNSELTEGSAFCPYCGSYIEPAVIQPDVPTYDSAPTTVLSSACMPFYAPMQESDPSTGAFDAPEPKKKPKTGLWILAAVAGLLVAVIIAGLCTNWFGFYGPATKIASAADKTLTAGSFTVDFNISIESESSYSDFNQNIDGTIEVILDLKEQELTMLAESEVEDITFTIAIYDGYLITGTSGYFSKQDISEELDIFFESYDSTKELDWEELLNSIEDDLYDEVSEVINFDKLEKCLFAYARKLNNNQWLKENAGYSSTKENGVNVHQFKPKNYKFLNASLKCFENAFIDNDDYDDLMDQLKDSKSELNSVDFELAFGIKSGKLTSIDFEMDQDDTNVKLELEFDKIGNTSTNENDLKDMLDKAS